MFNLLPKNLKGKIRSEYFSRLLIVIFASIIIIQISFLFFLFPSWLISSNKEKDIILRAEQSDKPSLDSEINAVNSTIKSINSKLSIINPALEYKKVTPFVDSILSEKTRDIRLTGLTYSLDKTGGKITLAGISATRESLVQFVKSLQETKLFKTVDLPISNFTKDKNINFSINIVVAS